MTPEFLSVLAAFVLAIQRCNCATGSDRPFRLLPPTSKIVLQNVRSVEKANQRVIGGLFTIHNDEACHSFDLTGLIRMQAMIYAIEMANQAKTLGDDVVLGYDIIDDCNSIDRAMRAAMQMMMGETAIERRFWIKTLQEQNPLGSWPDSPVIAVVGPSGSDKASAVSSLLAVSMLPQISYSATSIELGDKKRFPSFMRTVSDDFQQMKLIADLLDYFNWTFISVVATSTSYGRYGVQTLKEVLFAKGKCIAAEEFIDLAVSTDSVRKALLSLDDDLKSRAVAVLLIADETSAKAFFKIARTLRLPKSRKIWIATDSWSSLSFNLDYEPILNGALGLANSISSDDTINFLMYLYGMEISELNKTNPWFYDYVQKQNQTLKLSSSLLGSFFRTVDFDLIVRAGPVIDAVNALVASLKWIQQKKLSLSSLNLLVALHTAEFQGSQGKMKKFDKNGETESDFMLTNMHRYTDTGHVSSLVFERIGSWQKDRSNGTGLGMHLNISGFAGEQRIVWPNGEAEVPISACEYECKPGSYKIYASNRCCWRCNGCPANTISTEMGALKCRLCPSDQTSDASHTNCIYIDDYIDWTEPTMLTILILTSLGATLTVVTMAVLWKYRKTPVVKSANASMVFIQLTLLCTLFYLPFAYASKPNVPGCVLTNVIFGCAFSTIVGIFLVKTWHVVNIFFGGLRFASANMGSRSRFSRWFRKDFWLPLIFSVVHFVITVPYWAFKPPVPLPHQASCGESWKIMQMISICYIALLSLATTAVAYKARKLPENFNESRHISTVMLMLMLVWIGTIPAYFHVSNKERILIMSLAVVAAAFFIVTLMFGPKLYIIFFQPAKNTAAFARKVQWDWTLQQAKTLSARNKRPSADSRTDNEINSVRRANGIPEVAALAKEE